VLRAVAFAAALLLTALVVAGCGSSHRLDYEHDVRGIGLSVDAALAKLPTDDSSTIGTPQLRVLADDLREAADQLADLDPPDDVASAQTRLERGLRGVADAYDRLATRLDRAHGHAEQADVWVAFTTDPKVDAAFEDIEAAHEQYAREGYRVFGAPKRRPKT
jgi:hypothetical protein